MVSSNVISNEADPSNGNVSFFTSSLVSIDDGSNYSKEDAGYVKIKRESEYYGAGFAYLRTIL